MARLRDGPSSCRRRLCSKGGPSPPSTLLCVEADGPRLHRAPLLQPRKASWAGTAGRGEGRFLPESSESWRGAGSPCRRNAVVLLTAVQMHQVRKPLREFIWWKLCLLPKLKHERRGITCAASSQGRGVQGPWEALRPRQLRGLARPPHGLKRLGGAFGHCPCALTSAGRSGLC